MKPTCWKIENKLRSEMKKAIVYISEYVSQCVEYTHLEMQKEILVFTIKYTTDPEKTVAIFKRWDRVVII